MRRLLAIFLTGAALVLGGCGSSTGPTTSASTTRSTTSASTTTSAPTTSSASTPTTSTRPTGPPAPSDFQVESATFISAADGWVLGTTACKPGKCSAGTLAASIARTTDGGAHWTSVPAPRDDLAGSPYQPGSSGVGELRFADALDGWAFAPDLWTTHNGGATWTRVDIGSPGAQVLDLEAAGGEVDAVVTHCTASTPAPCSAQLWHSPVGVDDFTQVSGLSLAAGLVETRALALHAKTGLLLAYASGHSNAALWITTNGISWTAHPSPCGSAVSVLTGGAAITASRVAVLCIGQGAAGSTAKQVLVSTDAGQSFAPAGPSQFSGGYGGQLGAASSSTLAIATASGAAFIYRSTNGGASFSKSLTVPDGGQGWGDFGFTDATQGLAVHAPASLADYAGGGQPSGPDTYPATLFMTFDGGAKWAPVTI